ncbi:hypothetical protein BLNAU_10510 [Blattamonas nauphoetae]|uniref:Uncharacterized protein n=1 Tax=Blattamonas nauphoetae TaxID=2049346 RepID=A0ABQ9XT33_9EUKA|nr:hypothetical protein BLNAU_10510 [Blattamonas nauphoetae]
MIETTLSGSRIMNTSCVHEGGAKDGWKGRERVFSGHVERTKNPLFGTVSVDLNSGCSVLSLNTSFSDCPTNPIPSHPNSDNITLHFNENITLNITLEATVEKHVFLQCSFVSSTSGFSGGAIYQQYKNTSLQIENCSFDACYANGNGGVLSFYPPSIAGITFVLKSSSFVRCSARLSGGCITMEQTPTLTIADCVFLDCTCGNVGGVLTIRCHFGASPGISNCLAHNCSQTNPNFYCGGMRFDYCKTVKISSVCFLDCSSASKNGVDLHFNDTLPSPLDTTTVSDCVSTTSVAGGKNRVSPPSKNHLLPTPTLSANIVSLKAKMISETEAMLELTMDKAMTGRMMVLVDNSVISSGRNEGGLKIGRVVRFEMSNRETASSVVSVGAEGLLQQPLSAYDVLTAQLSKQHITVSPPIRISFTSLSSASCSLDESGTKAVVVLEGSDVPNGVYNVTLHNSFSFNVTFTEQGSTSISKANYELGVIGELWKEGAEFG